MTARVMSMRLHLDELLPHILTLGQDAGFRQQPLGRELPGQAGILQDLLDALAVEAGQLRRLGFGLGLELFPQRLQARQAVFEKGAEALRFLGSPRVPGLQERRHGIADGAFQALAQVRGRRLEGARQAEEGLGREGREVQPFGVLLPALGHGPEQGAVHAGLQGGLVLHLDGEVELAALGHAPHLGPDGGLQGEERRGQAEAEVQGLRVDAPQREAQLAGLQGADDLGEGGHGFHAAILGLEPQVSAGPPVRRSGSPARAPPTGGGPRTWRCRPGSPRSA